MASPLSNIWESVCVFEKNQLIQLATWESECVIAKERERKRARNRERERERETLTAPYWYLNVLPLD